VREAIDYGEVEQMFAKAIKIHRLEPPQRRKRPVVVEAFAAVTVGRGRGGINEQRTRRRAPVQEPQRGAEIGGEDGVSVGGGGAGVGAERMPRLDLGAVEPAG